MFNNSHNNLPPVVKNLLIINVLFYLLSEAFNLKGIDLNQWLGLHYQQAPAFHIYQLVTYMFMHANFMHLFSNMFGLFMFGRILEQVWGPKRFLNYYLITGMGAGLVQMIVWHFQFDTAVLADLNNIETSLLSEVAKASKVSELNTYLNRIITIGASGSIFGILLAFGMLFPNTELMLLFFPVPIKAKYFVVLYGLYELYAGVANFSGDNIAHFAHLGGMIFGLILILYWKKQRDRFY